jgi:hypothetical protein
VRGLAQRFTVLVALGDWKHVYPFNASMVNQGENGRQMQAAITSERVPGIFDGRKESVKVPCLAVRKVSTKGPTRPALFSFKLTLASEDCAVADSMRFRMHVTGAERRQARWACWYTSC